LCTECESKKRGKHKRINKGPEIVKGIRIRRTPENSGLGSRNGRGVKRREGVRALGARGQVGGRKSSRKIPKGEGTCKSVAETRKREKKDVTSKCTPANPLLRDNSEKSLKGLRLSEKVNAVKGMQPGAKAPKEKKGGTSRLNRNGEKGRNNRGARR